MPFQPDMVDPATVLVVSAVLFILWGRMVARDRRNR